MKAYEKYLFWVLFAALFISGIVFLYFRDFASPSSDPFSVVSSPWQSWMIKSHVLAAPIFVFWVGWVAVSHAMNKLKKNTKKGKKTGLVNMGLLSTAIFTGYLIQVITSESWNNAFSNIHLYISIVAFLVVFIHQLISVKQGK